MGEREPGYTVGKSLRVRLAVKGSRFIASLAPADTEKSALEFIGAIQDEFPDATHHTYAYRLGVGRDRVDRFSDAREPAGTAGPPMLQELERAGVTNAVLVATRYFGGIKLGIGGLARAYRLCARSCLEEARLVELRQLVKFVVIPIYDDLGPVLRYIEKPEGENLDINYTEQITVSFSAPASIREEIIAGLKKSPGVD